MKREYVRALIAMKKSFNSSPVKEKISKREGENAFATIERFPSERKRDDHTPFFSVCEGFSFRVCCLCVFYYFVYFGT